MCVLIFMSQIEHNWPSQSLVRLRSSMGEHSGANRETWDRNLTRALTPIFVSAVYVFLFRVLMCDYCMCARVRVAGVIRVHAYTLTLCASAFVSV